MYNIKAVAVGDSGIGKTSLLQTFVKGEFESMYSPTVFDTLETSLKVEGKLCNLTLCDTAGQEGFDRLRPLAYVDADIFVVAFAIDDHESFVNVKAKWVPELKHHAPKVPFIVAGLKCDTRKKFVSDMKDEKYYSTESIKLGALDYLECSAMDQFRLDDVFIAAIGASIEDKKRQKLAGEASAKGSKKKKAKAKKPKLSKGAKSKSQVGKKEDGCLVM